MKRHFSESVANYFKSEKKPKGIRLPVILRSSSKNSKVPSSVNQPNIDKTLILLEKEFGESIQSMEEFDFSNTNYFDDVSFDGFLFPKKIIFNDCKFNRSASFNNAIFLEDASFYGVDFDAEANFQNAIFLGDANFNSIAVDLSFDSEKANFHSDFEFDGAYVGYGRFKETTFFKKSTFNQASFSSSVDFTGAKFKHHPPRLSDVELPQQTIWMNTKWPSKPSRENSHEHITSYELLALKMNKVDRHQDKIMFAARANRSRRVLDNNPLTVGISWMYDLISGYGTSVTKSALFWVGHIFLGALLLMPQNNIVLATPSIKNITTFWGHFWHKIPISFANANSFLSFHRGPLSETYKNCSSKAVNEYCVTNGSVLPFNVVWVIQANLGIILLFFLLLTIRNRFRIG